ncbi:class I glutamine amidotransferase-like protein [Tilletiopsis washingtonensis]|uniref:Class I glutamine amidotransferase-like protein n=1 Tax=Tilletiopsis washingtonensis TaxID=58919 RepID=A0A316YZV7_9BASI|nr:class I glutamine amidotransferase-like protein [Tilletiopsis washingtonensis]PWN94990.1 class I glutamine amidotransferase-like protein [Tilletiopsis washingtonensis]
MTAKETIRMLVLETDEPHPKTAAKRGSFGDIFHSLFARAGDAHAPALGIETDMHFVVDDASQGHTGRVPRADEVPADVRAILITGSMYDAHGDDEWIGALLALLRELWQTRPDMRFAGVCFGHQLLARLLGGAVEQHPGEKWELSHTSMQLTRVGKQLFRTDDDELALHQMHQDRVTRLPSPSSSGGLLPADATVHVWASSPHTSIQGIYIRDRVFSTQGHLGFDDTMVRRQIELRKKAGSINESDALEVAEAEEKAHLEHDGVVVAGAILRFFHGDAHDIE